MSALRKAADMPLGEPFANADAAWLWTMAALAARRDGARGDRGRLPRRPCEPDDVVRCLDRLYRAGRIDRSHARVLRDWGERGIAPDPAHGGERAEALVWREALARLSGPLRMKGIIGSRG